MPVIFAGQQTAGTTTPRRHNTPLHSPRLHHPTHQVGRDSSSPPLKHRNCTIRLASPPPAVRPNPSITSPSCTNASAHDPHHNQQPVACWTGWVFAQRGGAAQDRAARGARRNGEDQKGCYGTASDNTVAIRQGLRPARHRVLAASTTFASGHFPSALALAARRPLPLDRLTRSL